jgi:hypothetical protein
MGASTVYLALLALLAFSLAIALVYEFVGSKDEDETGSVPPGGAAADSPGRGSAPGAGDAAEAPTPPADLEYGELDWQKNPKKETQSPKKRSSYERDRDLIKPEGAEGNPVR